MLTSNAFMGEYYEFQTIHSTTVDVSVLNDTLDLDVNLTKR